MFIICVSTCLHHNVLTEASIQPSGVVLSFHHVRPRDRTQVISLVSKCFYPLTCVIRLLISFLVTCQGLSLLTCLGVLSFNLLLSRRMWHCGNSRSLRIN